jgi:hypothetical protein
MMRNRRERIDHARLLQWLKRCLKQQAETVDAKDFLEQVVQISELLVEREPDEFEFAHLSFQEYLAATYIAQSWQEQLLYDHCNDDWWKPTILLYAAQVNPGNLIRELIRRGATDLAYSCLQDTTKRVDPALTEELNVLKRTVQNSRYAKLETYLSQGQWKEADQETYRLMITIVGKEDGQFFEPDELLNFPCEELLAIDGLWVKYSNGQFGFSVQKGIYLECGGIPDGKYHKEEFEKFGDRVQWRNGEKWDFNVLYGTSAPRGHLPACRAVVGLGFAWRRFFERFGFWEVLFSRIAHCKP